jgi:hypothetical protein
MLRIPTIVLIVATLLPMPALVPALAADAPAVPRHRHVHRAETMRPVVWVTVYPLSWRTRKIRKADNCWRGCQAAAGYSFQSCLRVNATNDCVAHNDAADRFCLRECRLSGGPILNIPQ